MPPDAFQQLELQKETHDQPDAIKTPSGGSLFGKQIITSMANKGTIYCTNTITTSKDVVHKRTEQFSKYKKLH